MTRVIITTSIRESPQDSISGRLFVVDVVHRRVLQSTFGIEPPHRDNDVNPRGGMRGLRGVSISNGELAVAIFSSVLFYDRSWSFLRAVTHPSVAAIHEIFYTNEDFWVTSTANDLLARFDHEGRLQEYHFLRLQKNSAGQLSVEPKTSRSQSEVAEGRLDFRKRSYFASDPYDRLHLNSVCLMPNGQLLISFGLIVGELFNFQMHIKTLMMKINVWDAFLGINAYIRRLLGLRKNMLSELVIQPATGSSAVACLNPNRQWQMLLYLPVDRNPSHSIRFLNDGSFIYLLTSFGEIAHFDSNGNMISRSKVTDKFLRGLLILPDGNFLIGASNRLLFFNPKERKVFAEVKLSDNELETIFDIQILPDDFDLPPHSLETITGRIKGYQGNQVIWERAG